MIADFSRSEVVLEDAAAKNYPLSAEKLGSGLVASLIFPPGCC